MGYGLGTDDFGYPLLVLTRSARLMSQSPKSPPSPHYICSAAATEKDKIKWLFFNAIGFISLCKWNCRPVQSWWIWRRNIYSKGNMMEIMLRCRWATKCLRFAHHSILGTSVQPIKHVYTKMIFTILLNFFSVEMASTWKACLFLSFLSHSQQCLGHIVWAWHFRYREVLWYRT